jgi:hypothetical protein
VAVLASTAAVLNRSLWPWQRSAGAVALERRPDGRYRYPIVTVCVPRQAGKTTFVGLLAIHRCMHEPDARVWYTAQSRMDAVTRFREFVRLLRRSALLELPPNTRKPDDHVWDYRVRLGVGSELLEFANGSELQVFSPAADSLHGSVGDLIIFDEARFFDERQGRELMAAALPTMATRDGQLWIVSTGGGPESTFLAGELERSRAELADPATRRCHVEYGIGYDVPDMDLLEKVWAAHPAAGESGGPQRDALEVAAGAMTPGQFAHEYGNRWRSADESRLIPASTWDAGLWQQMPDAGDVFIGVDVAVDRSSSAVVACVAGVLQVLDYRPGVTWLADRVLEVAGHYSAPSVWIDSGGPAGAAAFELGVRLDVLHVATTRELTAACGQFEDAAVTDPPLVGHLYSAALDESVAQATHRRVGQSWQWSRVESGPVLMAATMAYAAYRASVAAPQIVPMVW